jgi:hypothetical protein
MMAKQMSPFAAAFNSSYLEGQVTAHQMTIALFKSELAMGSDPKSSHDDHQHAPRYVNGYDTD